MSKKKLEEIAYSIDGEKALMSSDDYDFLYNYAKEQAERVQELEEFKLKVEKMHKYTHINAKKSVAEKEKLEKQNKRHREAREIIEQVYKENYVRNANVYGYEDGYLDGLDTAIGIIDKALEESE